MKKNFLIFLICLVGFTDLPFAAESLAGDSAENEHGAQEWAGGLKQSGGGIQYEAAGYSQEWFKPLSDINDFFK